MTACLKGNPTHFATAEDMVMLFATEYPKLVDKVISLMNKLILGFFAN